jgi:hypothetical protein
VQPDGQLPCSGELPFATAVSLLQALLAQLRRARETPLQFGIDSEGIVDAALKDYFSGARGSSPWRDWQVQTAMLDTLVAQFLQPEWSSRREEAHSRFGMRQEESGVDQSLVPSAASVQERGIEITDAVASHPLAVWLDRFYRVMTGVQPRAIDIVTLRVEGFQDRDIAERLELGLRLVRRIIQDMRVHWERVTGKE